MNNSNHLNNHNNSSSEEKLIHKKWKINTKKNTTIFLDIIIY